jgi:hypothetical protein
MAALLAKYDGGFYALVLVKMLACFNAPDGPARADYITGQGTGGKCQSYLG